MPDKEAIRWGVIRADFRNFFTRLPTMLRRNPTAIALIIANLYPVVDLLVKGEPVGSLLVVYWIQMMIIGFFSVLKLAVIGRWMALLYIPMFLLMYLSLVNFFGILVGSLLDDQMRGSAWHASFSLWNYWSSALVFFVNHCLSFWLNFIRGREFETTSWETQMGKPLLRTMPMWMAAIVGGFIGGFLNSTAWALLFVLPVKLTLDVLGHFVEHGMLSLEGDRAQPLWRS